jgi:pilus assembly protein CpaF
MLFRTSPESASQKPALAVAASSNQDSHTGLKVRIHQRLLDILNLSLLDKTPREALRIEIRGAVSQLLAEERRLLTLPQTRSTTS